MDWGKGIALIWKKTEYTRRDDLTRTTTQYRGADYKEAETGK